MTGRQALPRTRLDAADLQLNVVSAGRLWTSLDVVDVAPSTNLVLADRARAGASSGAVLVAEEQSAGRGRRDRRWSAPRSSSVILSVLVRPDVQPADWGWIPLLTAVAVVDAVAAFGVAATVKWPNDVLVRGRKLAGVLCEVVPTPDGNAVVAGWGINVDQQAAELPVDTATSMRLEGGRLDRAGLLVAVLAAWESRYRSWLDAAGDAGTDHGIDQSLTASYASYSSTLGRDVLLALPDGSELRGRASRLDVGGGLVVVADGHEHLIAAADVVHLRLDPT